MSKQLIISCLWCCCHLLTNAQPPSFSFRNISINEGLSQSSVVDIAIDSSGFAWFATQDGLNRYDGKEFVVFGKNFDDVTTLVGSRLGKLVCNNNGKLWLLTSGGKLEQLDLYHETFTAINKLGKDSVQLPPVTCFYEDRHHNQWIGTEKEGLFLYEPRTTKLTHYTAQSNSPLPLPANNVQGFLQDKQDNYWALTNNGLIVFNTRTHKKYLHTGANTISCSSLQQDINGNFWLGTYGNGLYTKSATDSDFHPFTGFDKNILPAGMVIQSLLADRNGKIWVGTYGNGLFVIDTRDNSIRHFTADKKNPFSLAYNDILSIKEDTHGGIWIGTDGGGVNHYDKRLNNFTLLSKNNVPENIPVEQVRSITTDEDGGIWIGTSNSGLSYANRQQTIFDTWHFPPFNKGISNYDRVVSLFADRGGDIWVGTQGNGMLLLNSKTRKVKTHFYPGAAGYKNIPDHTIWCILPDSGANVWAGTRNKGLCLLNKDGGVLLQFDSASKTNQRLPENNVRALLQLNDSIICIGFEKKGIRLLNTRTRCLLVTTPLQRQLTQQDIVLKCMYYQYPLLWIGTLGKGLLACNLETGNIINITQKQGLPNNTIYAILTDQQGSFWMSTNKGICRFMPPAQLEQTAGDHFNLFTIEDGLQSNEFNTGAYHKAADGRLFFGGISGLNVFRPDRLELMNQPVRVAITGMTVNNQPINEDTVIAYKKTLQLPHYRNSLSFNFAALDFVAGSRFRYFYQLLNYDTGWIEAGSRNYAAYTNLPPGDYTFRVKTSKQFGGTGDRVTNMNIIITPPFWKTWWFILLCVVALSVLLYAFYRYRISQLIHLQKIRNRIATDLHDDIGSTLTNISLLSEMTRKNLQSQGEARTFLYRISEEVQGSSQALDDIVWSINTNNDTLEQTVARMRRYAAEIFDGANIHYELKLDEQFAQRRLNMEQRRDCFLVFKEVINNIYKHAAATHVFIELWPDRNQLYMKITDNGKGFDPNIITHRNGIKNIRQRVEKWKGEVYIESSPGTGTVTRLHFPLY
jgi:ligand-binding sensor domain-containing protein/signal transduction histidine kinase